MDDLISRQSAIDAIEVMQIPIMRSTSVEKQFVFKGMSDALNAIKELPPAEPQEHTGRWIKISPAGIYECSECGKNVMTEDIDAYEFCHGCGCRMMEVDNEQT